MNEISLSNNRQNAVYIPVTGMIEEIQPLEGYGQPTGCYQILTLRIGGIGEMDSAEENCNCTAEEEMPDGGIAAEQPQDAIVRMVIGPDTCFVNGVRVYEGMMVTAFYDGNAPTVLIYPPQYRAVTVAEQIPGQNIMMGRFSGSLTAEDRSLKLNLDESVDIISENGQNFYGSLVDRTLIVVYGPTTRSIPPQTTPYQIIVLCRN